MREDKELILFQTEDEKITIPVSVTDDTVWLTKEQIAALFGRDRTVISRHVSNVYKEGELDEVSTCAKFAQVQNEGGRQVVRYLEYYNLDVIISVGYRVKSQRGVEFRRWANNVLKDYIVKGYAANQYRLQQLRAAIQIMKRTENRLDAQQILSVAEQYTTAFRLLDDYDHQRITKPKGTSTTYRINYEECREIIDNMILSAESTLFGSEKDDSFKSSIGAIYQTYNNEELYPTTEEKAANLLYFVTKNHSFIDGNKRIAAVMFLYFLDKNGLLFTNGEKLMSDYTLVAITIMIAESKPDEKEIMVNLIMNFLI